MTTDNNVQGEKPAGAVQETVSTEQPLTKEAVEKMIADAKKEATEETTRKMQSIKDREVAEVKRRFQSGADVPLAELTKGLDPDVQKDIELARYRAQEANQSKRQQEEAAREAYEKIKTDFTEGLSEYIQSEGLDTSDKRIDWGKDDESLLTRQKKVLSSITKIKKAEAQKAEENLKKKAKDLVDNERKHAGLEQVDMDISPSTPSFDINKLGEKLESRAGIKEILKNGTAQRLIEEYRSGKLK